MPPIRRISYQDGLHVETTGTLANIDWSEVEVLAMGMDVAMLEANMQYNLQVQYQRRDKKNTWPPDHRLRDNPPVLKPNEKEDGQDIITTLMFVDVHVFSRSPLNFTVKFSNSPISGDWWS